MEKNQLIKLIHVAKNQAKECQSCSRIFFGDKCTKCRNDSFIKLRDERYRRILQMITGKTSCSKMNIDDLEKVYVLFYNAGFRPHLKGNASKIKEDIHKGDMGTIKTIYGRGKAVLGPSYKSRIEGFARLKFEETNLHKLETKELRTIIGWINRLAKNR